MTDLKKSKKTYRVLYLYITAPLILLALVLGVVTLSTSRHENAEEAAKASPGILMDQKTCSSKADCLVGESCREKRCVNLLRESAKRPVSTVKSVPPEDSSAKWAAVMAAILAGLTGLMGAVAQTVAAFMNARERRGR